jgi:hypothetical protein
MLFGMDNRKTIDACIESLCQLGCREVRQVIAALEQGLAVPGTEGLGDVERALVLAELRAIMAVYGDTCRI